MATVTYTTIFKFKQGKSSAWTNVNPILEEGEPGYELDTGLLKIGDGSTAWNDLEYFGAEFTLSADGQSISMTDSGLELYGFSAAEEGQIPSKGSDGSLEWVDKSSSILEEEISNASDSTAGIMKLYSETGENEDGTMTQKSITEQLNTKISLEIDNSDSELLIFVN